MSKSLIKGILLVLNKIYWKIDKRTAEYVLDEASDLPGLEGYFILENDVVKFKSFKLRLLRRSYTDGN